MTSSIIATYPSAEVTFEAGRGCWLYDEEGNAYLDMLAGIAVASVGHCHPAVTAAIENQARTLLHASNLFGTRPQEKLAQRLARLTGGMLSFFCNSGAEANECAVKIARRWASEHGKTGRIIAAEGGFHGRTFGALSATGHRAKREPFEPLLPGFEHVTYGDIAALDASMGPDVAAVILEPIQGEAGVVVPPVGYLTAVRELCDRDGALLILDEVQTGLGRTGAWFAHEHEEIAPDVMCLAKALGGGLPIGACLATPRVASVLRVGDHASTFGGGPVQTAAALVVLDVIENEGLVERASSLGKWMCDALGEAVGDRGHVRGRGLLIGIELDDIPAAAVVKAALDRRLVINNATESVVRLTPPLVMSDDEAEQGVHLLKEAIDAAAAA